MNTPQNTYTGSRYLLREALKCLHEALFIFWHIELPQRRRSLALRIVSQLCEFHLNVTEQIRLSSLGFLLGVWAFVIAAIGMAVSAFTWALFFKP